MATTLAQAKIRRDQFDARVAGMQAEIDGRADARKKLTSDHESACTAFDAATQAKVDILNEARSMSQSLNDIVAGAEAVESETKTRLDNANAEIAGLREQLAAARSAGGALEP